MLCRWLGTGFIWEVSTRDFRTIHERVQITLSFTVVYSFCFFFCIPDARLYLPTNILQAPHPQHLENSL